MEEEASSTFITTTICRAFFLRTSIVFYNACRTEKNTSRTLRTAVNFLLFADVILVLISCPMPVFSIAVL
jgi:hypothetical protein